MTNPVIQTSFNAGEWAPALNARVDLAKYHSGAALLRNFFVDYRGGATTRPGTRYVLQTFSQLPVRIISFQASFAVTYILEFGQGYVRFFNNGAAVLTNGTNPSAITNANPGVVTDVGHPYNNGDWVHATAMVGMTQLNGNYYIIANKTANTYQLQDLFGNLINTTTFGVFVAGGSFQKVYTISSPYQSNEVAQIKFSQNVNQMILTHPNYPPYLLTIISFNNWTLAPINFGTTIGTPAGGAVASTLAAGSVNYAYVITAVDSNGQESAPSTYAAITNIQDIRSVAGTNTVTWTAVPGAVSYNIYRAIPRYGTAVPAGSQFGFVGNVTGLAFIDSNITPDFSDGPPLVQNPFSGSGVQSVTITANGSYGAVPTATFTASPGVTATGAVTLSSFAITLNTAGASYRVGDNEAIFPPNLNMTVTGISGGGGVGPIASFVISGQGVVTSGSVPTNNVPLVNFPSQFGSGGTVNIVWGVSSVAITNPGTGYLATPTVSFSGGGGATATAVLGTASSGNPTVPALFQQRLILAGPVLSPSQMNFSQPGSLFNFNTTFPVQADNAFQETLTNTTLNSIKSLVPVSSGLIVLSDKGAWLVNGGTPGSGISALGIVANSQGYSGAADVPPIVTPTDILYVQSKGSIVRDLAYNFYLNNYVGVDISTLSSHLFYGFTIKEWTWAEEPFHTAWAVRNDGTLLSLCFVKDQQMIAWAHHDTQGLFQSVTSITESTSIGSVDAVYHVVQRIIRGVTVQYIERFVELTYPNDYKSSWQVDAGIGYNGSPATTFSGAQHLGGAVVTGVADGVVINFTMPVSGTFVFGPGGTTGLTNIANASIVTVGLPFTPQIQTLALDLGGEPTVQGKRKKVSAVTIRAKDALGLSTGRTFSTLVAMKDLQIGNVGTMSNALVTGLQTTDARTIVDPQWDVFGQYCIQQSNPYPASVLGVVPEIEVGDSTK